MERPLVSVIIPSFNRSHVLRLCVGAIQAQTYSPIEIIVVDDCGTEDAAEVASSMGATVLRTEVNGGASPARNLGAEHSHGEILLFLDGDIALDPDSVENAVNILRSEPKLGALGGILHPEPLASRSLAAQYRALQMHYWWMPTDRPTLELHAAVLAIPAEVFKEIGPFNPNLSDTVSADYRYRVMQKDYEVRITAAVCGRADHDSTLRMILRKVFRRARVSAMEWARGETPGDSVPRAFGGVLLLAAVPALALPLVFGPLGALVSPLFVAAAVVLDGSTYRRVFARRGLLFGLYFSAVHLLVTLVGATGAGIGVLQRVLGRRPPSPQWVPRTGDLESQ
jgi:GT2 family glycosyltransferase